MRVVFALAAVVAFTSAASANSQSIEITYTERDLVDPARVELLEARIERAAEQVCGVRRAQGLNQRMNALRCAREAEERAVAQLARAVASAGGNVTVAAR